MSERMIRLLVIGSVVAVFLGGLVVGYVVGTRRATANVVDNGPPRGRGQLLDRFTTELGLSPEQRAAIEAQLREGERTIRETMQRLRPELEAKRASIERGILEVLTPDQRTRYREMLPHGLPRPPPPGGPPPGGPRGPGGPGGPGGPPPFEGPPPP